MPTKVGTLFYDIIAKDMTGAGLATAQAKMQKVGQTLGRVGSKLTRSVTLPLIAAGVASAKVAADFEKSMTKIQTLVGVSAKQVDAWGKEILDLGPKLGKSPRELAEALFVVTSAGQRGANAMKILKKAAKASALGLGETKEIARAVTSAMNAYGEENLDASRATDILTATVREGNLEASELAPVLGRVIGMASQLGISFEEVGASIATFTRLGVDSSEAVVGLRGIMNTLIRPTEQSEEALGELNLTMADLRKQVKEKGLARTLVDLVEKYKGNEEALGKVIPNVRALAAALGTAGVQGEDYVKILDNIEKSHGIVDEGFKETKKTAAQQWNEIKASIETSAIKIGAALLPLAESLKIIATSIEKLVAMYDKATPSTKKMVNRFLAFAVAAGPVLIILSKLIALIGFLITPIGAVTAALIAMVAEIILVNTWLKNQSTLIKAFSTLILGAVPSIVLFVVSWKKNLQIMKDAWNNTVNFVKTGVTNAIAFLRKIPSIAGAFLTNFFLNVLPRSIGLFVGFAVKGFLMLVAISIKAVNQVSTWFAKLPGRVINFIKDLITGVVKWIRGLPGKAASALRGLPGKFRGSFQSARNSAVSRLQSIMRFVFGMPGRLKNAGARMGRALWNGLKDWFGKVAQGFRDAMKGIGSPGFVEVFAKDLSKVINLARGFTTSFANLDVSASVREGIVSAPAPAVATSSPSSLSFTNRTQLFLDGQQISEVVDNNLSDSLDNI